MEVNIDETRDKIHPFGVDPVSPLRDDDRPGRADPFDQIALDENHLIGTQDARPVEHRGAFDCQRLPQGSRTARTE
jgi:hypothetical protein